MNKAEEYLLSQGKDNTALWGSDEHGGYEYLSDMMMKFSAQHTIELEDEVTALKAHNERFRNLIEMSFMRKIDKGGVVMGMNHALNNTPEQSLKQITDDVIDELKPYTKHADSCALIYDLANDCDCGLDKLKNRK